MYLSNDPDKSSFTFLPLSCFILSQNLTVWRRKSLNNPMPAEKWASSHIQSFLTLYQPLWYTISTGKSQIGMIAPLMGCSLCSSCWIEIMMGKLRFSPLHHLPDHLSLITSDWKLVVGFGEETSGEQLSHEVRPSLKRLVPYLKQKTSAPLPFPPYEDTAKKIPVYQGSKPPWDILSLK